MFDRSAYRGDNCSVARTLDLVGEKWTLLVLREAFYGVRRFDALQANLGVARNVLAARLTTLVEAGVLTRVPYREAGSRQRFEYRLTEQGRALLPSILALLDWGDTYLADDDGPPVVVTHRECGAAVHAELSCAAGHRGLTARDTDAAPGPGARLRATS